MSAADTPPAREDMWDQAADQVLAAVIQHGEEVAEFAIEWVTTDDLPGAQPWRRALWAEIQARGATGASVDYDSLMAFAHERMGADGPAIIMGLGVRTRAVRGSIGVYVRNLLELAIGVAVSAEGARPSGVRKAKVRKLLDRLEEIERAPSEAGARTPGFVAITAVEEQPVEWLWEHRIPVGALTILAGNAGIGKSTLGLELAARVTRGQVASLPGNEPADEAAVEANVMLITTEDHIAMTVKPRLRVAGADLERVQVLPPDCGFDLTLPSQIGFLRGWAEKIRPRLIVLDPLTTCLDASIDSHKDQDVRRALRPLYQLASEIDAAIVGVVHLKKGIAGDAPPMHRVMGSIGITAAARSVLLVTLDPEDPERSPARFVSTIKHNLAPPSKAVEFALLRTDPAEQHAAVTWRGEVDRDPLADPLSNGVADGPKVGAAKAWIMDTLAAGPLASADLLELAEQAGHSERTLNRARSLMPEVSVIQAGRRWWWELREPAGIPDGDPLDDAP